MEEIYAEYADGYEELVRHEDYQGNLRSFLSRLADWNGRAVVEAGCGTGRVTRLYADEVVRAVCFDRSPHMLAYAESAVGQGRPHLEFAISDNENLPLLGGAFDLFVEGWSFGHSAVDATDRELERVTDRLLTRACGNVRIGGTVILIETLGTNTESPEAPHERLAGFYRLLERKHGFSRHVVRTDYRFDTPDAAVRVMGFFFGERMAELIAERGAMVIPEWTGIWAKTIQRE